MAFRSDKDPPSQLLTEADNQNIECVVDAQIELSGMLDEARQFHNQVETGELDPYQEIPSHVQIADEAWRLLNTPKTESKERTVLLSDCWNTYAETKELDLNDRQVKKTFQRWNSFFDFVGDCLLINGEVHDALDRYVVHRERVRREGNGKSPSSSTIQKEIDMACAIINLTAKLNRLSINIVKPEVRKTEAKTRETLSPPEILAVIELAANTEASFYSAWKELALLIMAQTSCIASELQRMDKSSLLLDGQIPMIKFTGKLKTKNRARSIPLVYKVARIRELAKIIDPNSRYILGDIANKSESNISKQLKSIIEKVNPDATAYSFRHSFKSNAQINDIDNQDIAYLGGWSGSSMRVNEIMMNYGKKGLDSSEMALKLQRVMKKVNSYLLRSESGQSNIVQLHV